MLAGGDHAGRVYELGGDTALTLAGYAAELSRQAGREVVYRDLPVEAYASMLEGFGLPAPVAEVIAEADAGIARGDLLSDDGTLRRLIGRPITTLADAIRSGLS